MTSPSKEDAVANIPNFGDDGDHAQRRVGMIENYWRKRGYRVSVTLDDQGNIRTDMVNGLPREMFANGAH